MQTPPLPNALLANLDNCGKPSQRIGNGFMNLSIYGGPRVEQYTEFYTTSLHKIDMSTCYQNFQILVCIYT